MTPEDEYRDFARHCHLMALATNNPEWDKLAQRWTRCAEPGEGAREQPPPKRPEHTAQ